MGLSVQSQGFVFQSLVLRQFFPMTGLRGSTVKRGKQRSCEKISKIAQSAFIGL